MKDRQKERLIVRRLFIIGIVTLMLIGSGGTYAQELGPGGAAPLFELSGSDGNTHRLSDYRGRTVVLAWFPKAFTGG